MAKVLLQREAFAGDVRGFARGRHGIVAAPGLAKDTRA